MPFARPTLSELRGQVAADIASAKPGADALLRFSNLQILGAIQAAMSHGQYGYLDWIARQAVPFTATDEFLEGWAGLKGVTRKPATQASGQVTFTGTVGTLLPTGSQAIRGDGITYTTQADGTVGVGGSVTVPVLADTPQSAGNADIGTVLTLSVAVAGIQSNGAASTALTGGADAENDASFRSRMLQIYQAPPQGGDQTDYVEWALQVPGVTRAWAKGNGAGIGTVVVYTMFDVSQAAHAGFPQGTDGVASDETRDMAATGDQLAVADYIYELQPVTALVYSVSPVPHSINFTISGLSGSSSAVRAAIAAAIKGVFVLNGSPGGTINLSDIEAAINAIAGTDGFVITTPSANITNGTGELPVLGTVTYV